MPLGGRCCSYVAIHDGFNVLHTVKIWKAHFEVYLEQCHCISLPSYCTGNLEMYNFILPTFVLLF